MKKWLAPALLAVALVGCAGYSTDSTTTETETTSPAATTDSGDVKSGTVAVTIKDFKYSPATLTVKKGSKLMVTNEDIAGHSLTADDGSFDTGVLGKGKSMELTMDTVGTFKVHCTPHPSITGTITVVE